MAKIPSVEYGVQALNGDLRQKPSGPSATFAAPAASARISPENLPVNTVFTNIIDI
jgi:hypothetical protein